MFSSKTRWSQRSWHIFHHSLHRQLPKSGSQNSFIWCPTSGGKKLNFVAVINPQAVFTTINSSIHMPRTTLLWFLWKIFSGVLNCWSIFIKFLVNKNSSSEIYIFVNYYNNNILFLLGMLDRLAIKPFTINGVYFGGKQQHGLMKNKSTVTAGLVLQSLIAVWWIMTVI